MNLRGRDQYESLSHQGGPREAPPVRFGPYTVPAAVAWVLDPIGKSPSVRAEFEMRRGRPVCLSLSVNAVEGGRSVTTADLATLPGLDRKALDAFKALATEVHADEAWQEGRNLERTSEVLHPDTREVGKSLRSESDEELRRIAEVYRANVTSAPLEAVEAEFGISRRTASRRVQSARERGFLPETTQGKRNA